MGVLCDALGHLKPVNCCTHYAVDGGGDVNLPRIVYIDRCPFGLVCSFDFASHDPTALDGESEECRIDRLNHPTSTVWNLQATMVALPMDSPSSVLFSCFSQPSFRRLSHSQRRYCSLHCSQQAAACPTSSLNGRPHTLKPMVEGLREVS